MFHETWFIRFETSERHAHARRWKSPGSIYRYYFGVKIEKKKKKREEKFHGNASKYRFVVRTAPRDFLRLLSLFIAIAPRAIQTKPNRNDDFLRRGRAEIRPNVWNAKPAKAIRRKPGCVCGERPNARKIRSRRGRTENSKKLNVVKSTIKITCWTFRAVPFKFWTTVITTAAHSKNRFGN